MRRHFQGKANKVGYFLSWFLQERLTDCQSWLPALNKTSKAHARLTLNSSWEMKIFITQTVISCKSVLVSSQLWEICSSLYCHFCLQMYCPDLWLRKELILQPFPWVISLTTDSEDHINYHLDWQVFKMPSMLSLTSLWAIYWRVSSNKRFCIWTNYTNCRCDCTLGVFRAPANCIWDWPLHLTAQIMTTRITEGGLPLSLPFTIKARKRHKNTSRTWLCVKSGKPALFFVCPSRAKIQHCSL